jgi:RHS repeat-associated protein
MGPTGRRAVVAGTSILLTFGAIVGWTFRSPKPGSSTKTAARILSVLRAQPGTPLGQGTEAQFYPVPGGFGPRFKSDGERPSARVVVPPRATAPLYIENVASQTAVNVTLTGAKDVAAQIADGYFVYPHAYAGDATLLHRVSEAGSEDYLSFENAPPKATIDFRMDLKKGVAGLRLVERTLELLDASGTPQLRVAPPYVVGADGARTEATLAVEDCAVDTSPAAPWGREVTSPGASSCTVRVRWPDEGVVYPALLDPSWTTTGSMTTTRQGHTATLLSTGNVLVAGGTSNGTTALASAELYNRTTGTWSATASMTGARTLHSATQLNTSSNGTTSGMVLIAGGINGSTSQSTAQLYSPSAGTWTAAANLNAARHAHSATLLADGRVLVAGGLNGTTTLTTAALYNPASGTGTWTATSGQIPPPGLKNHTASLLVTSNGQLSNKVLLVGGNSGSGTVASVFLFDPTSTSFNTMTTLASPREGHTATTLANGNVLITGGKNGSTTLATTQLFNPSSSVGTWSSAGNMTTARQAHTATLLPAGLGNGQLLVAGGSNGTSTLGTAELWDGTSTWTATTALLSPVQGQTATLLPNNLVLIAGGVNGTTTVSSAALYNASSTLSCTTNSQCSSGFCVSGVCCNTACNGGCGVCNLPGQVGTCSAASSGTVCRAAAGACDVAETCNGTSLTCPTDGLAPATTVCRAANGTCDVAEKCTGTSAACPADGFAAATTVCRAANGTCDVAEKCTGTSAACPADGFVATGTTCRPSAGACDVAEACTGTSAACPADGFAAATTVCRAANGACDVAETCSGASAACPADHFAAATTVCRPAAGACDVAETCTGTSSTCPADGVAVLGTVCRGAAGPCDVPETCNGTSTACPTDGFAPATTVCRASVGACDTAETCTGTAATCPADKFAPATTVCRPAAGPCDVAETCTGSSNACPADSLAASGAVCRAAVSLCDVAETCSGTSTTCPADAFAPAGTVCGAVSGNAPAPTCSGTTNACAESGTASDVLGFEVPADWSVTQGPPSAIVGSPNTIHTQGQSSLELAAQGYTEITSAPMTSLGAIGTVAMIDVMLPTNQANPPPGGWFGGAQMFVSCPSQNINHQALGEMELSGLPLATWETLAFQIPASTVQALSTHTYSDLTFSVVLNVPANETGHYLLDDIRFTPDVIPSLVGIAQDGTAIKAIFDYTTSSATDVNISYGPANGMLDQNNAFIQTPTETPPSRFVSGPHDLFVATITGSQVTWTLDTHTVTATLLLPHLPVTTLPNGQHVVTLASGQTVNLDSTAPSPPPSTPDPTTGAVDHGNLTGSLSVSPSGAAIYTVPINIPPGVAGMAPDLKVVYNSQGADGPMGQGWSLTGLSMISRCPSTLVQNGTAKAINIDGDKAPVCLDGKQLFQQTDPVSNQPSGIYKTETEDFSTITQNPTSEEFDVQLKNGEVRHYGSSENSRVILPSATSDSASPFTNVVWLLDKVEDAWGNYYLINYNEDDVKQGKNFSDSVSLSGIRVTSMQYTGNPGGITPGFGGGQQQAAVPPPNTVNFVWSLASRKEARSVRFGAWTLPLNRELQNINTPAGQYVFNYAFDTDPSTPTELSNIEYCIPGQNCLELQFGWNKPSYSWQPSPGYTLPQGVALVNDPNPTGTYFVDLNNDGLPDLVESEGSTNLVWQNTGSGWTPAPASWKLPVTLLDGSNPPKQKSLLVDIDGDGLLDIITPGGRELCDQSSGNCIEGAMIWYNRINTGGGWQPDNGPLAGLVTYPEFGVLNFATTHTMADMNGDGRADLILFTPGQNKMQVALNFPSGWQDVSATCGFDFTKVSNPAFANPYQIVDVNHDGLGDVTTATEVIVNQGCKPGSPSSFDTAQSVAFPGDPATFQLNGDFDGDGYPDVLEDFAVDEFDHEVGNYPAGSTNLFQEIKLAFAIGNGFAPPGDPGSSSPGNPLIATTPSTFAALTFQNSLANFLPPFPQGEEGGEGATRVGDINGDGLTDVILQHPQDGQKASVLFNTGAVFKDGNNATVYTRLAGQNALPAWPDFSDRGVVLQDVNGDGLPDLVQGLEGSGQFITNTWLNTYQKPIITTFPNQRATPSTVAYEVITTGAALADGTYSDPLPPPLANGTTYLTAPLNVVKTITTDKGLQDGSTDVATYQYASLRGSAFGRGPQGFNSVTVTDAASGMVTQTFYSQVYPYTGLPVQVTKGYLGIDPSTGKFRPVQFETTVNTYCATTIPASQNNPGGTGFSCAPPSGFNYPPMTTLFTAPSTVDVTTTMLTGTFVDFDPNTPAPPTTETTTSFIYDDAGNATTTTVVTKTTQSMTTAAETWLKTTVNDFGAEGSPTQRQGKLANSTTTSQQTAPGTGVAVVHHTNYIYAPTGFVSSINPQPAQTPLTMMKKRIEPNSGDGFELDTALNYDRFGNIIKTTECANDFDSCGATGEIGEPSAPFRVTSVSYDPADFVAPAGTGLITSVSTKLGQFPVRKTNAAGHTEYSVYDPVFGVLLQNTGPNGVTTCFTYDRVGRKTTETTACGSAQPLQTTIGRYAAGSADASTAVMVTVVKPPDGRETWSYTDPFNREVETLDRNANGGLTEIRTAYTGIASLVLSKTQPFLQGATGPAAIYAYDGLLRPSGILEFLGDLHGTGENVLSVTTTKYAGGQAITTKSVNGVNETRTEFKNAIGKLGTVIDANGHRSSFIYDGDGKIVDADFDDPGAHAVKTIYDIRGRRQIEADPDMGSWIYTYDAFGDLLSRTNNDTNATQSMTYDVLGRMTGKTDSTGASWQWVYDKASGAGIGRLAASVGPADIRLNGACTSNPLITLTDGNRPVHSYSYDAFGRVLDDSECTDGETFVTSHVYDGIGREASAVYPAINGQRASIGYHYTNFGYLQYLTDDSVDGSVLWQAKSTNALGQLTDQLTSNGVETVETHNQSRGWLLASTSTAHLSGDAVIQNSSYTYDEAGNLLSRSRSDAAGGPLSSEQFGYDSLNRLLTAETIVTADNYDKVESYMYDDLGNLTQKGTTGYQYNTGCTAGSRVAGPHAVCSAGSATFSYDANGNVTSGGGRSYTYNSSNRAVHIDGDASTGLSPGSVDFVYDSDDNRVIQIASSNGATARTLYVGMGATGKSLYERTTNSDGSVQHVEFIYAGSYHKGNAFAVRVVPASGSTPTTQFYNFDHLGSVTAMSDQTGQVLGASSGSSSTLMNYDAWGLRRNPDGESATTPGSFSLQTGHREYSGHETIPDLGLINMNGRIYDPVLGRFLSPDPNVQFLTDLQSYNRYSYVHNNPLSFTDPTGFFSLGSVSGMGWVNIALSATGIVGCAISGGSLCVLAFGLMSALLNVGVAVTSSQNIGQTLAISAVGIFAGSLGGVIGGAVADGLAGSLVGGALSGALSSLAVGAASGKISAKNILESAAEGAAWAAASWGAKELTPVDQAASQSSGVRISSGAAQLEEIAIGKMTPDQVDWEIEVELDRGLASYDQDGTPIYYAEDEGTGGWKLKLGLGGGFGEGVGLYTFYGFVWDSTGNWGITTESGIILGGDAKLSFGDYTPNDKIEDGGHLNVGAHVTYGPLCIICVESPVTSSGFGDWHWADTVSPEVGISEGKLKFDVELGGDVMITYQQTYSYNTTYMPWYARVIRDIQSAYGAFPAQ